MSTSNENISPQVLRRVAKELAELVSNPPEGIKVHVNDDDITDIQASISGPESTPFEGGLFRMKLVLPTEFPSVPPKGFFVTKIFHPNVSKTGDICVNTLKKDWKPELGIRHVLTVVKCLLIHPNPASALNEEAGKLLLEDYESFCQHAKMMTSIHAKASAAPAADSKDGDSAAVAKKKKAATKAAKDKKRGLKRL
eukprot:m.62740 g.62740  ORF g.62740 m.62740 type:complete len:196 (-) comp7418_c0_seq1:258-845(-)